MAKSPPDRMQDIQGVADALRSRMDDTAGNSGQRDVVIAGILIALLGIGAWLWSLREPPSPPAYSGSPLQAPIELHVGSSAGATGSNWSDQALRRSLIALLRAGNDFRVVNERQHPLNLFGRGIPNALAESAPKPPEETTWQLELHSSADHAEEDLLEVQYRLAGPGAQRHEGTLTGTSGMLADLATRMSIDIRTALGLPLPDSTATSAATSLFPNSAKAQQLLVRATEALAQHRFAAAVESLQDALQHAPAHPMIEQGLARAYKGLGYEKTAIGFAESAVSHSNALPREQQLDIEADLHTLNKSWPRAGEVLGALHLLFPGDLGYGLRLAATQVTAGMFDSAQKTLDGLRALDGNAGRDPRIDLLATNAEYSKGDWAAGLHHAKLARSKASASGNPDLEALALWWINRLDADKDESHITRAEQLFKAAGNTDGQIASITRRGTRARARGDFEQSARYYAAAIALARDTDNESRLTTALGTLAILKDLQGELAAGLEIKEEVLQIRQRRGNETGIGISLENLGISHYKLGNISSARARFGQANAQFKRSNDLIGLAWAPWHEGRLLLLEGRAREALTKFEHAARNAKDKPEGSYQLHARFELLQMRLFESPTADLLAQTLEHLEELRQDYLTAELLPDAAETLVLKAKFEHALGNDRTARELTTQAYNQHLKEGAAYYRLNAATQLVKFGDLSYCSELKELASRSEHRYLALMGLLALASCEETTVDLSAIKQESERLGLFEPFWLATHFENPSAATALAAERDWRLTP